MEKAHKFAFTLAEVFHHAGQSKNFAFTLAEVLITLSVIGIVAALTIPTLVQNYQQKAEIAQIRKVVSDFENAADMLITEEGKSNLGTTSLFGTNGVDKFLTEKFNVVGSGTSGFSTEKYRSINGREKAFSCTKAYILSNGATVCVTTGGGTNSVPKYMHVQVDTNGTGAPNIGGRDMFDFYINRNAKAVNSIDNLEATVDDECKNSTKCTTCTGQPFGEGCLQKLEQDNWNMNY